MSRHSELDIAIQENKVLQEALLREVGLHGEALFELTAARGQIELLKAEVQKLSAENARLRGDKGELCMKLNLVKRENEILAKRVEEAQVPLVMACTPLPGSPTTLYGIALDKLVVEEKNTFEMAAAYIDRISREKEIANGNATILAQERDRLRKEKSQVVNERDQLRKDLLMSQLTQRFGRD